MPGDIRVRAPGRTDLPTRFFGLFTGRDLLRIGVPASLAIGVTWPPQTAGALLLILGAVGLGVAATQITVRGRTLDEQLVAAVRWMAGYRSVSSGPVQTKYDHIETSDGTAVGVIKVTPTNLSMKTQTQQRALHRVYQDVAETVTYPVTVHSRQRQLSLSEYISTLRDSERSYPAGLGTVQDAYTAYCQHLNRGQLVTTDHYLLVHVTPRTTDQAAAITEAVAGQIADYLPINVPTREETATEAHIDELDRRCTELQTTINRGDLDATRVTGPPLVNLTKKFHTGTPDLTPTWLDTADDGSRYRRQLAVTELPTSVALAWPLSVLTVPGTVDVTQTIHPRDTGSVVSTLSRTVERLEAEIGSQQAAGHRGTNRYERAVQDANWLLDLLADRDTSMVDYGCYITVHATDQRRCEETLQHVETRLQTMQIQTEEPLFRTDQAYTAWAPLHRDRYEQTVLVPAQTAAAGFPFATTDAINQTGVVYGEHAAEGTPILLDRFQWEAPHVARMGQTGSGKSYATKLELLRAVLAYDDLAVYVIDPKGEYQSVLDALGGDTVPLSTDAETLQTQVADGAMVGVAASERGGEEVAERLVTAVNAVYATCSQSDRKTLVVVDEAHNLLEDAAGRQALSRLVREARDTNTGVTLLSQNAEDFTHCRAGRAILDNTPCKIFQKHDRVGESVQAYFQLSDRECQEIVTLQTGTDAPCSEAVLKVAGRVDTKLVVRATTAEHRVIESDRSEGDE